MKTTIIILLGMFVWAMMPIEAMAARGDQHDRRSTPYSDQNRYDRHERRSDASREHRNHHRHQRVEYRYPTIPVRYVTAPLYRTVVIPTGYLYTSTPGVSLYFSW